MAVAGHTATATDRRERNVEIAAEGLADASTETVFAFLSDLDEHWLLTDRSIELVSLEVRRGVRQARRSACMGRLCCIGRQALACWRSRRPTSLSGPRRSAAGPVPLSAGPFLRAAIEPPCGDPALDSASPSEPLEPLDRRIDVREGRPRVDRAHADRRAAREDRRAGRRRPRATRFPRCP
jgi:hypothetical protein